VTVRVVAGLDGLVSVTPELEALWRATAAPITARFPWLEVWARHHPEWEPVTVLLGDPGRLAGAALLARRARGRTIELIGLGQGRSDYARLPARDERAAQGLGRALAEAVSSIGGPWHLRLEQLPRGDPAARAAAEALRSAAIVPGDGAPVVRIGEDRSENRYLGRSLRHSERRRWKAILRDGIRIEMAVLFEPGSLAPIIPEMQEVRRQRDLEMGRGTDDERTRAFRRELLLTLAARGELEVTILRLDGELAAYASCCLDGSAYRQWDTRFLPQWKSVGAGSLVTQATIRRVLDDPRFDEYDHMRGLEEHKFQTATEVRPAEHLLAWSSPAVRLRVQSPPAIKETLKRWRDRVPVTREAWRRLKARRRSSGD
jgi:Acetyltransferase (GNAT) domain